jgi:hypothetical protein
MEGEGAMMESRVYGGERTNEKKKRESGEWLYDLTI